MAGFSSATASRATRTTDSSPGWLRTCRPVRGSLAHRFNFSRRRHGPRSRPVRCEEPLFREDTWNRQVEDVLVPARRRCGKGGCPAPPGPVGLVGHSRGGRDESSGRLDVTPEPIHWAGLRVRRCPWRLHRPTACTMDPGSAGDACWTRGRTAVAVRVGPDRSFLSVEPSCRSSWMIRRGTICSGPGAVASMFRWQLVHGLEDDAVPVESAAEDRHPLFRRVHGSPLCVLDGANHVFNVHRTRFRPMRSRPTRLAEVGADPGGLRQWMPDSAGDGRCFGFGSDLPGR